MTAMKKIFILISVVISMLIISCSATKESRTARAETRQQKNLINQALIQNAVESRRFIIKFERLYLYGGMLDLKPRTNYIIVDGQKAIISAAYFGRQYDIRPIAGINMRGVATDYEVTKKMSKGVYDIKMKVGNGATAFDVYLTINRDGSANASLNGIKITNANYRGYVVPISDRTHVPLQDHNLI